MSGSGNQKTVYNEQTIWKAAGYSRRSFDDLKTLESNTITNQKNLIGNFINNLSNIILSNYYVDDRYTGTNFDRPSFKEMMKDIISGKINTIVVKDLSRICRNYIEVGNFIDEIIRLYELRFISINDNIDSFSNPKSMGTIEVPIKNLMNESYAKDISKKVRSSFDISKRNGKYIGVVAPYGYMKSNDDVHQLLIDPDASIIVKQIFQFVLQGLSRQAIAEKLNNLNVLTPSNYIYNRFNFNIGKRAEIWNEKMIDKIITNQMYTGCLVQGKSTRISHKIHNIVKVPKEDWILVEDNHKPIISKEAFYQANNILFNRDNRINKNKKYNLYTGHLKCGDCGASLSRSTNRNKPDNSFYYCSSYKRRKECSKHYINEESLNDIVIATINKRNEMLCNIKDMMKSVVAENKIDIVKEFSDMKIKDLTNEINKYKKFINSLEIDFEKKYISKKEYDDYHSKYSSEVNKIENKIETIRNELESKNIISFVKGLKINQKIVCLNKALLDELIDFIYVYEDGSVKILFRYKNEYDDAIKFLKSNNYMI